MYVHPVKRGPEILERYFCTAPLGQVHFFGCPKKPQGQGFMAQTSMTEQGMRGCRRLSIL